MKRSKGQNREKPSYQTTAAGSQRSKRQRCVRQMAGAGVVWVVLKGQRLGGKKEKQKERKKYLAVSIKATAARPNDHCTPQCCHARKHVHCTIDDACRCKEYTPSTTLKPTTEAPECRVSTQVCAGAQKKAVHIAPAPEPTVSYTPVPRNMLPTEGERRGDAQPAGDQTQWESTGYTQAVRKNE